MFNYFLYRLGQHVALALPLRVGYALATCISDLRAYVAKEDRVNVQANLRAIFPDKSDLEVARIQKRMFRNFARYLVDFFRFPLISKEYAEHGAVIVNRHYVDSALRTGKGAVLLTAHLGNWELGGAVMALLGYPICAVALPHRAENINTFFNRQRISKGLTIFSLGHAARLCLSALQHNKLLALLGDRDFTEKGAVVDFFGRPTHLPLGPAHFSLKTGAPIIPVFTYRDRAGTFYVHAEEPIVPVSAGMKENDAIALINRYVGIIERYIRNYPDQWYMFRRFWIS